MRIESNPQKMLESVIMFGNRKRDFLRSSFLRGAAANVDSWGFGGRSPRPDA
jgi:hypothetical protein